MAAPPIPAHLRLPEQRVPEIFSCVVHRNEQLRLALLCKSFRVRQDGDLWKDWLGSCGTHLCFLPQSPAQLTAGETVKKAAVQQD